MLDAIERVEIGVRAEIVNLLGSYGTRAHRDPSLLDSRFARPGTNTKGRDERTAHQEWLSRLDGKFRDSKAQFAMHFRRKHPKCELPIWAAAELWDFGMLSRLYGGMREVDRDAIAALYDLPNGKVLRSWLRNLNVLRNMCAHHTRLWNNTISVPASWPSGFEHMVSKSRGRTRFHASAVILCCLLKAIQPASSWKGRLKNHILAMPFNPSVSHRNGGFADGWEFEDVWA